MPRRRTLDDLLRKVIAERRLTQFCKDVGISPWTLQRMRNGEGTRNHRGTILAMATELGVSEDVVRKAIEATRKG
jgi:DNA-binding Xre family transcriptional regulator